MLNDFREAFVGNFHVVVKGNQCFVDGELVAVKNGETKKEKTAQGVAISVETLQDMLDKNFC